MSNLKKRDAISNDDSGLFTVDAIDEWDVIPMGDMLEPDYDPNNHAIDPIIQTEPEHRKYIKLNKHEKSVLKELWIEIVSQYWRQDHQIPFGEHYSRLKKELLDILEEQGDIALKDDNDLKVFLHDSMIITINKLLK